jgi:hypothetical protein
MKDLSNAGILNDTLPLDIFNKIKNNIINKKYNIDWRHKLAGNIENEYLIDEVFPDFENYLLSIAQNNFYKHYIEREIEKFNNRNAPRLQVEKLWVNYQKKHEFNPVHNHSGLFSFVLFVSIPYDIKEEFEKSPGKKSNYNTPSCLEFHHFDVLGNIFGNIIPVDKTYEGKLYFFPSSVRHCVYPFYTSDDYRITISGNVGWVI